MCDDERYNTGHRCEEICVRYDTYLFQVTYKLLLSYSIGIIPTTNSIVGSRIHMVPMLWYRVAKSCLYY